MFGMGGQEIALLVVLGVLLFGNQLPRVGRMFGKSVKEFKNGIDGIESDVENVGRSAREPELIRPPQRVTAAPKFEDVPA